MSGLYIGCIGTRANGRQVMEVMHGWKFSGLFLNSGF